MMRLILICWWSLAAVCWAEPVSLVSSNARVLVTIKTPQSVHLGIEEISANTTIVITWRDEDHVWPQRGKLLLRPSCYDANAGHTFYRSWSYYRLCECCNETITRAPARVKVDADNVTTGWLELLK